MTTRSRTTKSALRALWSASARRLVDLLGQTLGQSLSTHRQRRALTRLDDHLLRDIGITRDQAEAEANTPLWDAPWHWKI